MRADNHFCHGTAQSAEYGMLLSREDAACFSCRRLYRLVVQRTNRGHIEHAGMNAFPGEQLCRSESLAHQYTVRDQGDVITIAQERGLPDLEVIVSVMDY